MSTSPGEQPAEADPWTARERVDAAPQPAGAGASTATEPEWWESPGMPWKHKPGRADKACFAWFMVVGVFGLVLLPVRAKLLAMNPIWLMGLLGSRSGTAATGALASQGMADHWVIALFVGALMSIKFDWIYWWAGKLWGRGMIEVWAGHSKRATRNYARAERWAQKLGWLGIFVAYVPIPLPLMQVIFVLAGATGMGIKKFLVLDYLSSLLWLAAYFAFGWSVGEPAVELLKGYAKIANWVAIGLVVFILGSTMWSQRKKAA